MVKYLLLVMAAMLMVLPAPSQEITSSVLLQKLLSVDTSRGLSARGRLDYLKTLKKIGDRSAVMHDSIYAKLLHKLGLLEFDLNRHYDIALSYTRKALEINLDRKSGGSGRFANLDIYNLGYFYDALELHDQALVFYDSAINRVRNKEDPDGIAGDARLNKAYLYFRIGDYQKSIEESFLGIQRSLEKNDSLYYLFFLNQRAQAFFFEGESARALSDVTPAINLALRLNQPFQLASACKTKGYILSKKRDFRGAEASFRLCIRERLKTGDFGEVSGDYNDFGLLYSDSLRDYGKAISCLIKAIKYAEAVQDSTKLSRISINLGKACFRQGRLREAMEYYDRAILYLGNRSTGITFRTMKSEDFLTTRNKILLQLALQFETELLLTFYKRTAYPEWLTSALHVALLNDTLIGRIRHEQLGDQSKLLWREVSRGFFRNAIEISYLSGDDAHAFYFMEKSRSVMLQDKLNELGASSLLPPGEAARQDSLRIILAQYQQDLSRLRESSPDYVVTRIKTLQAKDDLEHYIHSLEKKYPAYYQYKYADEVPTLSGLQGYLGKTNQQFIEYFIDDSSSFAVGVTSSGVKLLKLADARTRVQLPLATFGKFCANESAINTDYSGFIRLGNSLYSQIFLPFHPRPGRVIISQDNDLFPFEALSSDSSKDLFLVRDYSFSYVYSARYLLGNPTEPEKGKGNFLGIAPVRFRDQHGIPDLGQSEAAISRCSRFYPNSKLLLTREANHFRFLEEFPKYEIVTVLTHAMADSSDNEPLLYLYDSAVHLSELQLIKRPSTKLILLSACLTNVGKNYSGEGIFSLARGFSTVGVPAVAATLWEADEQSIYFISDKFNEYIAMGMNKDEALQKAKLDFIKNGGRNSLPALWAALILVGDSDPIRFSAPQHHYIWLFAGMLAFLTIGAIATISYKWHLQRSADPQ